MVSSANKRYSWDVVYPGTPYTDFQILCYYMVSHNIKRTSDDIVQQLLTANLFSGRHNTVAAIDKRLSIMENVARVSVYNKDQSRYWWPAYQTMYRDMVRYGFDITNLDINRFDPASITVVTGSSRSTTSTTSATKQTKPYTSVHAFEYIDTWERNRIVLKSLPLITVIDRIIAYGKETKRTFTTHSDTIRRYMNGGAGYEQGPPNWFQQFASWVTQA